MIVSAMLLCLAEASHALEIPRLQPMTRFVWRHDIRPCITAAAGGFFVGLVTCCYGVDKVLLNFSQRGNLMLLHFSPPQKLWLRFSLIGLIQYHYHTHKPLDRGLQLS